MSKPIYLVTLIVGGWLAAAVSPVQAWWGNNWAGQQGGQNYYGGYYNQPQNYDSRWVEGQQNNKDDWWHGPWNGGTWEDWRAPWSNDDSRWGSGPWDGFGESMNSFIGSLESDVDLNMKIRAENQAKTKAQAETHDEFRGNNYRGYYYPGYYNPYHYGYRAPQYQYYQQPPATRPSAGK